MVARLRHDGHSPPPHHLSPSRFCSSGAMAMASQYNRPNTTITPRSNPSGHPNQQLAWMLHHAQGLGPEVSPTTLSAAAPTYIRRVAQA
jgi:hypothetical protein